MVDPKCLITIACLIAAVGGLIKNANTEGESGHPCPGPSGDRSWKMFAHLS